MFADLKPPRQAPKKLMHVCDAGPDGMVQMLCQRCRHQTSWLNCLTMTEAKRGIPCPKCNATQRQSNCINQKSKMSFGARVRMHREQILNWSIDEAASDAGICIKTLSLVETGWAPDIVTLEKLCRWMSYSLDQAEIDLGYSGV